MRKTCAKHEDSNPVILGRNSPVINTPTLAQPLIVENSALFHQFILSLFIRFTPTIPQRFSKLLSVNSVCPQKTHDTTITTTSYIYI